MPSTTIESARAAFRDRLLADRVLIDGGAPGLYGRGPVFVRVYDAVDAAIVRNFDHLDSEVLRFPPVEALPAYERTDYIASFPDLAASISSFTGDDRAHRELLAARNNGERWERFLEPADLMLTPAVCHPLFATLDVVPTEGQVFDVIGDVFRHEPSLDPMRMQTFHQHEFVYVGSPEGARNHRDTNIALIADLLRSFGLEIGVEAANDPFFGRVGRILAKNQVAEELKFEFVTPVYGQDQPPTAITSTNLHEDHFGEAFGITTADGATAHSACFGFGVERITLALIGAHGSDLDAWPVGPRAVLGL
jgi:seryl-tRNA synthetase